MGYRHGCEVLGPPGADKGAGAAQQRRVTL